MLYPMPAPTLAERLQGDRQRRPWKNLRQAADYFKVSTEKIRAWTAVETIPERWRAPELASFINASEQEILHAMDEQDRQRRAARDLQAQIDIMRHEAREMNDRIDQLVERLDEILERISEL